MRVFYVNLAVSIALIIGGFFRPPLGVIDGSVLTAVGLLLMFTVVAKVPEAIKAGRNIKLQKGDGYVGIYSSLREVQDEPTTEMN